MFLDYPDAMLEPTLDLRRDIAREIRRYRPDVLICPYPMRNLDGGWGVGHPDHIAAGEATLSAVFPSARDHLTFPELLEEGLEPHKVAEVYVMSHPEPDLWVDVTDHIDTSVEALSKHASQVDGRNADELGKSMREWRRRDRRGPRHTVRRVLPPHHLRPPDAEGRRRRKGRRGVRRVEKSTVLTWRSERLESAFARASLRGHLLHARA